jgi:hypothetical protein
LSVVLFADMATAMGAPPLTTPEVVVSTVAPVVEL